MLGTKKVRQIGFNRHPRTITLERSLKLRQLWLKQRSKPETQSHQHQARSQGTHCIAKVSAGDIAQDSSSAKELRVIEKVEGFAAEFKRSASFDGNGARESGIEVLHAGAGKKRRRAFPMVPGVGSVS